MVGPWRVAGGDVREVGRGRLKRGMAAVVPEFGLSVQWKATGSCHTEK